MNLEKPDKELIHKDQLDNSLMHVQSVPDISKSKFISNSAGPDQMPHNVASDKGLSIKNRPDTPKMQKDSSNI